MRLTKKSKDNFLYEGKHITAGQPVVIESRDEAKLEKLGKIEIESPPDPPRKNTPPTVGSKSKKKTGRSYKNRY